MRTLKIILNCKEEEYRKLFAKKISEFYNVNDEKKFMNQKYLKLKEKIYFLDKHLYYKK